MTQFPRILDNNLNEVGRLHPISMSVDENIIPLSSASMEVDNSEVIPGRTWVEIFTVNGSAGVYRTRVPEETYGLGTASIQIEHGCCEIGDYLITDELKEETSVTAAFEDIFDYYGGNRWQLGSFVATETVTVDADYTNVLEALLSVMEQVPQYMMTFDFGTTPWTLSIAKKSESVDAEGRLSRNITSAVIKRDDKDLCTRVYVRGLPIPAGRKGKKGKGYMDSDTISQYGVVERDAGGDSDTTLSEARRIAQVYLDAHKHPKLMVELDGYDLSKITGESLDSFRLGKLARLTIPEYNVVVEDHISEISWNDVINTPTACRIVIGIDQDPMIEFLTNTKGKGGGGGIDREDLEETASALRSLFGTVADSIMATVEDTASSLRNTISDMASSLRGMIDDTNNFFNGAMSSLRGDVADTIQQVTNVYDAAMSNLRGEIDALKEGVYTLRIVLNDDNTYTLQKKKINSNTWVDVGTFSRATSLSGSWSGAVYTVTASPQGNTNSVTIVQRISGSSSGVTASAQFGVMDGQTFVQHGSDTNGYLVLNGTGSTAKVDLNSRNDGTGVVYARKSVSTVWNNGYDDAKGKIEYPEEAAANTEVTSFTLKVPNAARDGQDTKTFSLAKGSPGSSGYASVSLAGTGVVGRIDISNWWKDGWDDARAQIDYPDELKGSSEVTTFYLEVPNAARTGHDTKTFTVTKGTPGTTGFAAVSLAGVGVVGRISIGNWYCTGSSDVTLTNPSYNSVSTVGSSRTVTVSTSGRVNSSGAAANLSKSVSLYLSPAGWSGSSQTVYLRTDNATTGTVIAKTSISAPTVSMNPSANQTLNPGGSVTVYAIQNSQSVASVKVSAKSIVKVGLDSNMNHVGSWWNYILYYSDGTNSGVIPTNQSSTGLYFPVMEQAFTANDTYDAKSHDNVAAYSKVTVNVSGGATHNIDIPTVQIYTSGTSRGTKLTTLRNRYEEARADAEYVMFRVDCGGTSKWYYMEP